MLNILYHSLAGHVMDYIGKTFESSYPQNLDWHCAINIVQILALCHSDPFIFLKF
jgi:hypothetical protein